MGLFLGSSLFNSGSILCGSLFLCSSAHGEGNTLLGEVNVGDLNLHFIANLQDILGLLNTMIGNLRNVDQTVDAGITRAKAPKVVMPTMVTSQMVPTG